MDVGAHLRSARERRSLTLEQVARSTKLSPLMLRLIERNEWERLPGGLLTRGHLRAYAREVGIDPELVVRKYVSQLPSAVVAEPPRAPAPVSDTGPSLRPLLASVVGLAVTFGAYHLLNEASGPPIATSSPAVHLPVASESLIASPEAADPMPVMDRPGPRLSLEFGATGPCWVSARADGSQVVYRLLDAGDAITVAANEEILLRVGDPEKFRYTLNGVAGRRLGDGGRPVTVRITEGNVRSFVAGGVPDAIIPS